MEEARDATDASASRRRLAFTSLALAALACLISAGAAKWGVLGPVELWGYDLLVAAGSCVPRSEVVIVDFDEASVEALDAFPIPRALLATVIDRISAGEPELIGLDILLDRPRDAEADARLAVAIEGAGNVIIAEAFGTESLPPSAPLPFFRQSALDAAFVNMPLDADGFIRRMYLWWRTEGYQGLSLPVVLASNYLQHPLQPGTPGTYRLGGTEIPVDDSGLPAAFIGQWCSGDTVPVGRLLDPGFDPGLFQGRIVVVGQSSTVAKDLYPTPTFRKGPDEGGGGLTSGSEIHAAALATLLGGKTLAVLDGRLAWTMNLLLAWLAAATVLRASPVYGAAAVLALAGGALLLARLLFSQQGMWIPFVSTEAGLALTLPGGLGVRYLRERRLKALTEAERRELMDLFGRYVSPEVAAEIWQRRDEIVLEGQEKTATVLFSDIRGFTSLTAGRPSVEVLAWLNEYFDAMSAVIEGNGGFLNKFLGDGLLVLFGVPLSHGAAEDANRAVKAALEMLEQVEVLNRERQPGRPEVAIGIGLHTGSLTVGNVGARERLEYSVIGETVNLASRLEALTKDLGTAIVMSPDTRELVRDHYETIRLGQVEVRGFPHRVPVYTVDHQPRWEEET